MTAEARGTTLAFCFLDIETLRNELWGWTGYVPSDAILSQTPQLQAGQAGTGPPTTDGATEVSKSRQAWI